MKIGLVLSNPPAYSETFFNSKIKGLINDGFDVKLFVQTGSSNGTFCPVVKAPKVYSNTVIQLLVMCAVYVSLLPRMKRVRRFIHFERKQKISWSSLLKKVYLNAHLLKADLDWVHFGFATQALGSECVAKAIGAKMAVSFRGFDINVYPIKHPKCYDLLWKNVDKVHSISKFLLHQAYDLRLSAQVPYEIITPAVANEILENNNNNNKGEKNKPVELLTIARLHWIKGIDVLIETAELLKEKGFDFSWKIIGSSDQKTTERYQYHIYEKGLQQHIQLLGRLTHKETLMQLQKTNVYVQPSLNEGFCNAVLEAQAMGKLCIATNVGGLPENIEEGVSGWLVPKQTPSALSCKIIEVCALPKIDQYQVGIAAVNRVKTQFTLKDQQQKFVKFYQNDNVTQPTKE